MNVAGSVHRLASLLAPALVALVALGALGGPRGAAAQEALVLSGGGSRGLAHAGVFLGLAEAGYEPDLVVGTSAGAVVGALYAAGYRPEEIRDRILAEAWDELFMATPLVVGPDRDVRYPMLSFDLDVESLRASRGLVSQWRINRILSRLLFDANARSRGDFDRMARRYRAVATDLETGERVVLDGGDLARAARASMAVPGIFAPVEWEGRVLVDGGLTDNLPIEVARALGAERVIAVDVARPSETIVSRAPLAVLQRSLDLMQAATRRDTVPPDHRIEPAIPPGHSGATFPRDPSPLLTLGLAAVREDLPPRPDSLRPPPPEPPSPPEAFSRLEVEAPDSALAALARAAFEGVVPGTYDPEAVLRATDRLYTTGLFEGVWPRVEEPDGPEGGSVLVVRLEAPPELSLSGAAGYENDRGGRLWVAVDRHAALGTRPVVLTASASRDGIERWAAASARIFSSGRSGTAWSVGMHAAEHDARFFLEDAVGALQTVRAGGWLALELPHVLRDRMLQATLRAEWVDVEEGPSGASVGPKVRFGSLNPEALVVGTPLLVEGDLRGGTISYGSATLSGSRTWEIADLLVAPLLDLRWSSADAPPDQQPALGDEPGVPGLRWGEERGSARVVAGMDAAWPVLAGFATLRVRTGAVAGAADLVDDASWIGGAQVGLYWRSPVGVVEAGWSVTSHGSSRVDVSVGRVF